MVIVLAAVFAWALWLIWRDRPNSPRERHAQARWDYLLERAVQEKRERERGGVMIEKVWSLASDPEAPVHAVNEESHSNMSWCGSRPQFRHRVRPGSANAVTCVTCLLAIKRGQPMARGARR